MFLFVETKIKHYICIVKQTLKVMATISETIAAAIADSINDNHGSFSLEVEMDGNTVVEVSGRYEIDGYREDDYLNGTGAWVTTRAALRLTMRTERPLRLTAASTRLRGMSKTNWRHSRAKDKRKSTKNSQI